jgi:hypothetical protein
MSKNVATLKEDIKKLSKIDKEQISIGDISDNLGASAGVLLAIILATPMCLPFANIPGIAQAVGVALAVIFYRFIIGKDHVWLPKRVSDTKISKENLNKISEFLIKYLNKSEKYLKPRLTYLTSETSLKFLNGFCIFMVFILVLPLVIPLTNFFPGLSLILINFGIIQRDGYVVLAGILTGIFSVIFIAAVIIFGFNLVF